MLKMFVNPIVIVGGFGSSWRDYLAGARALTRISGQRVFVTDIGRLSWPVASLTSYGLLLDRTHKAVMQALRETGADSVTLIGHSAGGVVARAYLGDDLEGMETKRSFAGRLAAHAGHQRVNRFFALGSPLNVAFDAYEGRRKPLKDIAWANRRYPGAYFPHVQYVSVYGKAVFGRKPGLLHERMAFDYYDFLAGRGEQWGDAVVPNALSRVEGIPSLELEGMAHSPRAAHWYLSDDAAIRRWWHYFEQGDAAPASQAFA